MSGYDYGRPLSNAFNTLLWIIGALVVVIVVLVVTIIL